MDLVFGNFDSTQPLRTGLRLSRVVDPIPKNEETPGEMGGVRVDLVFQNEYTFILVLTKTDAAAATVD